MTKHEITPPTVSCHLYVSPLPCFVIFEGKTDEKKKWQRARNNRIFLIYDYPLSLSFCFTKIPSKMSFCHILLTPTPPMSFVYLSKVWNRFSPVLQPNKNSHMFWKWKTWFFWKSQNYLMKHCSKREFSSQTLMFFEINWTSGTSETRKASQFLKTFLIILIIIF